MAEDAYCNGIVVDGIFTLSEYNAELTKPLTVNTGKNLTLNHGAAPLPLGNTLTVNGAALTSGRTAISRLGSVWDAVGATLVNKGNHFHCSKRRAGGQPLLHRGGAGTKSPSRTAAS